MHYLLLVPGDEEWHGYHFLSLPPGIDSMEKAITHAISWNYEKHEGPLNTRKSHNYSRPAIIVGIVDSCEIDIQAIAKKRDEEYIKRAEIAELIRLAHKHPEHVPNTRRM